LFSSTLAGGTAGEQREAFSNARDVPFAQYTFEALTRYSGDLAGPRIRRRYPGQEVRTYHVVETSRIADAETVGFIEDNFFTFTRGDDRDDPFDGWRLSSTSDLEPLGFFSAHHLWDGGRVVTASSDHFVALTHSDRLEQTEQLLGDAELAYAAVVAWWPRPAAERYVLVVPSTTAELGDIFQATVDLSKFVAFAAGSVDRERVWAPAGVRMFVNPPNFARYSADGRRLILAHELVHAVTRPQSGPLIPSWVEEGLAQIGSEPGDGLPGARRGPPAGGFPDEEDFFVGPTADIVAVYRRSQLAMKLLADRVGVERVAALYETLGRARVVAGTEEHHLAAAAEAVGWPVDEWLAAWRAKLG
jgi:hypothetical protein